MTIPAPRSVRRESVPTEMNGHPIELLRCDGRPDQAATCAWVAQYVTAFLGSVGGGVPVHGHAVADLSDAGAIGRQVVQAGSPAAVLAIIGADAAGAPRPPVAHGHVLTDLAGSGPVGRAILAATDQPAACAAAGAAPAGHAHTAAEVGAATASHTHTAAAIGAAAASHTHTAAEVGAAPAAHTHALDALAGSGPVGRAILAAIDQAAACAAAGAAPAGHAHTAAEVGAAAASHTHTAAAIGAAAASHTHTPADLTGLGAAATAAAGAAGLAALAAATADEVRAAAGLDWPRFHRGWELFDDFMGPLSEWQSQVAGTGASVTGANLAQAQLNAGWAGAVYLNVSGVGARCAIGPAGNAVFLGRGPTDFIARLLVPAAPTPTESFAAYIGWFDAIATEPVDGVYLRGRDDLNAGMWEWVIRVAGAETVVNTFVPVTSGAEVQVRIRTNPNGTGRATLGTQSWDLAGLPVGSAYALGPGIGIRKQVGATSRSLLVDLMGARQTYTTPAALWG